MAVTKHVTNTDMYLITQLHYQLTIGGYGLVVISTNCQQHPLSYHRKFGSLIPLCEMYSILTFVKKKNHEVIANALLPPELNMVATIEIKKNA